MAWIIVTRFLRQIKKVKQSAFARIKKTWQKSGFWNISILTASPMICIVFQNDWMNECTSEWVNGCPYDLVTNDSSFILFLVYVQRTSRKILFLPVSCLTWQTITQQCSHINDYNGGFICHSMVNTMTSTKDEEKEEECNIRCFEF